MASTGFHYDNVPDQSFEHTFVAIGNGQTKKLTFLSKQMGSTEDMLRFGVKSSGS